MASIIPSEVDESPTTTLYGSDLVDRELVAKSLENVREPSLDPRVEVTEADEETLDEGIAERFSYLVFGRPDNTESIREKGKKKVSPIYIEFAPGSQHDPLNFPSSTKWRILAIACFATLTASTTAGAYNLGFGSMTRDLNCTEFQATIGLSLYALGFGIVPLFSASFSEEFGRFPLYLVSGIGFLLMYLMIALAPNIQTVLIARFLQGAFGSTGSTMVGGTVADIWAPKERGLPMSIFALVAIAGTGLGPVAAGWVEQNPKLEWKWIQWIQMIICALYLVLLPLTMKETRSSILLTRAAKKLRKETGDNRYRARIEDQRASLKTLIWISCTRPLHLLLTEPVVLSFSIWIGFAWGVLYCLVESIGGAFGGLHGFSVGQVGTVFLALVIGSVIGFVTNLYQEVLYQRHFPTRGPEARLFGACFAAVLLPIGMFIYAWTSYPRLPWIAEAIGIAVFLWGVFIVYLAVFSYLADCYGPFASSALAGQSLARNLAATAFPLFTQQMYKKLHYTWANTLFGGIAALLVPIPYILLFHGPAIRMRSKISRAVMEAGKS